MNPLFEKIAGIVGSPGMDSVVSEGEAIDVKLLALELLLPENSREQSDCENLEAVNWICWADWIISGDCKHTGLNAYRLPWLNANIGDARLGKCLPLKPLMDLQELLTGSAYSATCLTDRHAVLVDAFVGTTWKLTPIKGVAS